MTAVVIGLAAMAVMVIGGVADAQTIDDNQAHWRTTFNQLLGIRPDPKPLRGTVDLIYNAVVVDAQRFAAVGLSGVKNGDRLRLTHLGEGFWRIKHLSSGIDFQIDLNPTETTGAGNLNREKP